MTDKVQKICPKTVWGNEMRQRLAEFSTYKDNDTLTKEATKLMNFKKYSKKMETGQAGDMAETNIRDWQR